MAEQSDQGQSSKSTDKGGGSETAEAQADAPLLLNTHYIKDLSFENPNAPLIYGELQKGPNIDVTVNVEVSHLQERLYEVVLELLIKANVADKVAFLAQLDLAGMATVGQNIAEDEVEHLLLTEVPRYLFPFARATIGEVTRDGGFPPLLINPIDFEAMYRSRQEKDAELARTRSL